MTELELKNQDGIILGERENVVSGINGSFTLNLQPGATCSAARTATRRTTACSSSPASASSGASAAGRRAAWPPRRTATAPTSSSSRAGCSPGRRSSTRRSRAGNLAPRQGAVRADPLPLRGDRAGRRELRRPRPGDRRPRERRREPARWTGFHRIEQILWVRGTTHGTKPYGDKLLRDVTTLDRRVKTLDVPAGAARERRRRAPERGRELQDHRRGGPLLAHRPLRLRGQRRRARSKAFELLRPALVGARRRGARRRRSTRASPRSQKGLDKYRRSTPLGFALYSALTPADRRALAHAVDALAEPLSTVAGEGRRLTGRSGPVGDRGSHAGASSPRPAAARSASPRRGRRLRPRRATTTARRRRRSIPFYGEHQAGIATAAQDRLVFGAFDLTLTDRDRARRAAARLDRGGRAR